MRENRARSGKRHNVVVLLLEPAVGFDAAIPPLVFGQAADDDGNPLYEVVTCSLEAGAVQTTSGYSIVAAAGAGTRCRRYRDRAGHRTATGARRR